jgi:hypothetical protein
MATRVAPLSSIHSSPISAGFQPQRRISMHFPFLLFFYRTLKCRDIDCQSLVKISEILAGAGILLMPKFLCHFGMGCWYNQAGTVRDQVLSYKLASRLQFSTQLLHEEKSTSSEENTSEDREEPATVDFARPKQ